MLKYVSSPLLMYIHTWNLIVNAPGFNDLHGFLLGIFPFRGHIITQWYQSYSSKIRGHINYHGVINHTRLKVRIYIFGVIPYSTIGP